MYIYETASSRFEDVDALCELLGPDAEIYSREEATGYCLFSTKRAFVEPKWDRSVARTIFETGRCGLAGGEYLFKVELWVPNSNREELLAWYRDEHLPMLLKCSEWEGCRFFESPVAEGARLYACHQLASKSALDSEERKASRQTPWFCRLKAHDWFDEAFLRRLYRRFAR